MTFVPKFRPDKKPEKVIKIKKGLQSKYNPTGEGEIFLDILATNPHISFITGLKISFCDYRNCAHVLSKKQYPKYRLYKKNIVLLDNCQEQPEHYIYDYGTEEQRQKYANFYIFSQLNIIVDWDKLYNLAEFLKSIYPLILDDNEFEIRYNEYLKSKQ